MKKIFISYRRDKGSTLANLIKFRLDAAHLDSYLDVYNVKQGDYVERINSALQESDIIIPVLTENFYVPHGENDITLYELRRANASRVKFIPIAAEKFSNPSDIPPGLEFLPKQQTIFYDPNDPASCFDELLEMINETRAAIEEEAGMPGPDGNPSDIVKGFYRDSIYSSFRLLKEYLCSVVISLATAENLSELMHYCLSDNGKTFSILSRTSLLEGEKKDSSTLVMLGTALNEPVVYDSALSGKLNALSNDFIEKVLDEKLNSLGQDENSLFDVVRSMLLNHSDEATLIKIFLYMKNGSVSLEETIRNAFGLKKSFRNDLHQALQLRNSTIGHAGNVTWQSMNADVFKNGLHILLKVLSQISPEILKGSEEYQNIGMELAHQYYSAVKKINNCIGKADAIPIPLADIYARFTGLQKEQLQNSRHEKNIDWDRELLYFDTMEDLGVTAASLSLNIVEQNDFPAQDLNTAASGNRRQFNLPELSAWEKGFFNEKQIEELIVKSNLRADASCFMNEMSARFVFREIIPKVKEKTARKFVLNHTTRVELYQYECGTRKGFGKAKENAKNAHTLYHRGKEAGYIQYAGETNLSGNSLEDILAFAAEHPDKLFTVLTANLSAGKRAAEDGLRNVVIAAIAPVPGKKNACGIMGNKANIQYVINKSAEAVNKNEKVIKTPVNVNTDSAKKKNPSAARKNTDSSPAVLCVPETGECLPVSIIPAAGDEVYTDDHQPVRLLSEINAGGEGTVYRTSLSGMAAKIYLRDKLTKNRKDKILFMQTLKVRNRHLCWPERALFNKNREFVGFLMKEAGSDYIEFGKTVMALSKEAVRKTVMTGWDRLSLAELLEELSVCMSDVIKTGCLIGDVNPRNILLNPKKPSHRDFLIIDCDSFQVGGYPCPVGTVPYTSPEIYKRMETDTPKYGTFLRTVRDEEYAAASLFFRILMFNSPFAGKGVSDVSQAMKQYRFVYRSDISDGKDTPDGAVRLIWNNTPKQIKGLFTAVFTGQGTATLQKWRYVFKKYAEDIEKGLYTKDLTPNKYWDIDGKFTVPIICADCKAESNEPKERYEKISAYAFGRHLCPKCFGIKQKLMQDPEKVPVACARCGRPEMMNKYDASLIQRGERDPRTVRCRSCRSKAYEARNRQGRHD